MSENELEIFISKAKYTPEVILDKTNDLLSFKGVSYPENASKFYDPIINAAKNYVNDKTGTINKITIEIDLDYFNTATAGALYKILYVFNDDPKINADLIWCYEKDDDDLYEAGKDFEYIFKNIKFHIKEKND